MMDGFDKIPFSIGVFKKNMSNLPNFLKSIHQKFVKKNIKILIFNSEF